MSDVTIRRLEREAAQGDEAAQERLQRVRQRSGFGRHGDKIGQWCVFDGVRDHYRGRLVGVTELGGGRAILHLNPAAWLQGLDDHNNEIKIRTSDDHPLDLSSDVVGAVSLQPEGWPE